MQIVVLGLAPMGVSVPTAVDWMHVPDITRRILLIPPYLDNFGKRLIKSPNGYPGHSGLACYLPGNTSQVELDRPPKS